MLRYSYPQIVFQEVPGEISLALSLSGCNIKCKGCHSSETWNSDFGNLLSLEELQSLIDKNKHISCVLFYGGEWDISTLSQYIEIVKDNNLLVALYTGRDIEYFSKDFIKTLDYIKVGKYIEELGGLDSDKTNQKLHRVSELIL